MGIGACGDDRRRLVVNGRIIDSGSRGVAVETQQVIIGLAYFIGFRLLSVFRRINTFLIRSDECNQARKFKPPEQYTHSGGFLVYLQPELMKNPGDRTGFADMGSTFQGRLYHYRGGLPVLGFLLAGVYRYSLPRASSYGITVLCRLFK